MCKLLDVWPKTNCICATLIGSWHIPCTGGATGSRDLLTMDHTKPGSNVAHWCSKCSLMHQQVPLWLRLQHRCPKKWGAYATGTTVTPGCAMPPSLSMHSMLWASQKKHTPLPTGYAGSRTQTEKTCKSCTGFAVSAS